MYLDIYAIVLALATLGGTTEIGSFLFLSHRPRWPRQVQSHVAVVGIIAINFANENIVSTLVGLSVSLVRAQTTYQCSQILDLDVSE